MAYQPIQMTARPPIFDAMGELSQSLAGLGQDRRADAQYADQQKRQKQSDYQSAMAKASELWHAGDRQGAYALLAPYQDPSNQGPPPPPRGLPSHIPPEATKVPPPAQPQQPQGGSPMPDGMEFPQGAAPGSMPSLGALGAAAAAQGPRPPIAPAPGSSPMLGAMGNAANQGPIDPGMVDSLPMGGGPPPGPAMAPGQGPPPEPPPGPPPVQAQLFAAQEATKARDAETNQRRAMHLLAPGGQHVTWDPQGQQEAIKAERLARMDAIVKESNDPTVNKYYSMMRPFLSEHDWHPSELLRFIHQQEATEAGTRNAETKATTAAGVWEDRKTHWATADTTTRRGQDMTLEGRKIMGMNFGAGNPLRVDASNRGDTQRLETAVKDVVGMADGKALVKSNRALNQAIVNIAAEGPKAVTQHKDAFLQLERYFKGGGTPTEGEAILLLHNMGGIAGAKDQFLADVQTGDFSQITIDNLAQAATEAKKELDGNVNAFMGALKERVGPGTEFEGMGSNVNHMVKAVGQIYNLNLPDLYQGEAGENQVKLGSGLRSPGAADPAPSGTKAPKKKPKPAPAESEEVTWAKAHVNSTTPAHGTVLERDVAADILRKQGAKR